jgi:hypothetical protein
VDFVMPSPFFGALRIAVPDLRDRDHMLRPRDYANMLNPKLYAVAVTDFLHAAQPVI